MFSFTKSDIIIYTRQTKKLTIEKTPLKTSIKKEWMKSAKAMTQWYQQRVMPWIVASSKSEVKRLKTCPTITTTCSKRLSSSIFWLKTQKHLLQIEKSIGTKKLATMPDFAAGTVHMLSSISSVKKIQRSSSWCRLSRVVFPKRRPKPSKRKSTLRCRKPQSVSQLSSSRVQTKGRAIIENT